LSSPVDSIARKLRLSPEQVRARNLYQDGDRTHFGQALLEYSVPEQWQQLYSTLDFESKQKACAEFNRLHRYKKRGVSLIPTKFGISFTAKFLNQAGALVLVYSDGTVLVSHGGTEIGQGLNTKMAQVAAHALGIPLDWVSVGDTATDKVPNTSPTAASASSDLNGAAVQNACEQIMDRLKPLREKNPSMG
jgi:xanthine dehydrogenase/oxidase